MGRLFRTNAPATVALICLMVGAVFISEGIQEFLFPSEVGAGRFDKIGFDSPEFVACVEIGCGCLVLLGLATRLAVVPLIIMVTAIVTTKIPILQEQ